MLTRSQILYKQKTSSILKTRAVKCLQNLRTLKNVLIQFSAEAQELSVHFPHCYLLLLAAPIAYYVP